MPMNEAVSMGGRIHTMHGCHHGSQNLTQREASGSHGMRAAYLHMPAKLASANRNHIALRRCDVVLVVVGSAT